MCPNADLVLSFFWSNDDDLVLISSTLKTSRRHSRNVICSPALVETSMSARALKRLTQDEISLKLLKGWPKIAVIKLLTWEADFRCCFKTCATLSNSMLLVNSWKSMTMDVIWVVGWTGDSARDAEAIGGGKAVVATDCEDVEATGDEGVEQNRCGGGDEEIPGESSIGFGISTITFHLFLRNVKSSWKTDAREEVSFSATRSK